jgi:hypothetical protein
MKTLWRLFSRLLASLLSTVLLLCLLLLPLTSFVAGMAEPSKLVDLIFSLGALDALSLPSEGEHKILLSKEAVVSDSENPLADELKEQLDSGKITVPELFDQLKEMFLTGKLDDEALSQTLHALISAGAVNIKDVASELGTSFAVQQLILSLEGTLDFDTLTEAFDTFADSELLDMDTLTEELDLPSDVKIDSAALAQSLAKSNAMQALISAYTEDVLNAATNTGNDPLLTSETVTELLAPHMEEIATIVENSLPENVQLDRAKLTGAIEKAAAVTLPALVNTLPPAQEVADTIVKQDTPGLTVAMEVLKYIRSGFVRALIIGAIAILSLLIVLLRLPGFSGLRWIGTDLLTAGVLAGIVGYGVQTDIVQNLISSLIDGGETVVLSVLSDFSAAHMPFLAVYGGAGLVVLIFSGFLNIFSRD